MRAEPVPLDRDGVPASQVWLPAGTWVSVLDFLCSRFPAVPRKEWQERMQNGRVLDETGSPLGPETPFHAQMRVYYFRSLAAEPSIPFEERVLYEDERVLVADKPHFLPVVPSGRFVDETLLVRLRRKTGLSRLVPMHRLDRETAGIVLFCKDAVSRGKYQALFREQKVRKLYEALAAPAVQMDFPLQRHSRIVRGSRFFTMREEPGGVPNSSTTIRVLERMPHYWRYQLEPLTGKTHQLRLHMLGLGLPILNDLLYPVVHPVGADDYAQPLKLLARTLAFDDPFTGRPMRFDSERDLQAAWPDAGMRACGIETAQVEAAQSRQSGI